VVRVARVRCEQRAQPMAQQGTLADARQGGSVDVVAIHGGVRAGGARLARL
jgi:hypothetical protein